MVQGEKAVQVDGHFGGRSRLGAGCVTVCIAVLSRFILQGFLKGSSSLLLAVRIV